MTFSICVSVVLILSTDTRMTVDIDLKQNVSRLIISRQQCVYYQTLQAATIIQKQITPSATDQWLKWFCEAGGAHLTKPGWSKPHTHSNSTNLALFRRKIALYRFNQGAHTIAGGSNWSRGLSPRAPSL